jgi:hypothetical protein
MSADRSRTVLVAVLTDNETCAGKRQPVQALQAYRGSLIVIGMTTPVRKLSRHPRLRRLYRAVMASYVLFQAIAVI